MADREDSLRVAIQALGLLSAALLSVEDPHRWTRRGYALDGRGRQVRVDDPLVTRVCLIGAVLRAEHLRTGSPMPIATDPDPGVDDLDLPVATDAPPHVALALEALGWSAIGELEQVGLGGEFWLNPDRNLTLRHAPMLLGLLRRTRSHATAIHVLAGAIGLLGKIDVSEELLANIAPRPDGVEPS